MCVSSVEAKTKADRLIEAMDRLSAIPALNAASRSMTREEIRVRCLELAAADKTMSSVEAMFRAEDMAYFALRGQWPERFIVAHCKPPAPPAKFCGQCGAALTGPEDPCDACLDSTLVGC